MKNAPSKNKSKSPSSKSVFSGYIALLRPVNALMSAIGVFIGYALATQGIHLTLDLLYAMLAVFFISGGGQAINDYFDLEIDKKQKNTRPLASGLISKKMGLIYAIALFALGIVLASFINTGTLYMAGFFSILLFVYSALMSKIKFVGNLIVAVSVGFTYIFGATAAALTSLVVMISIPALLANWAREIIKDVEDQKADKGHKITLPHILKAHHVNFVVLTLMVGAILTGYLPVVFANASLIYTSLISASNVIFILAARELVSGNASKSAKTMKSAMFIALAAQISLLFH